MSQSPDSVIGHSRADTSSVPVIDLWPWFHGSADDRRDVARGVDKALREIGFLLIINHGIAPGLRDDVRVAARKFFALPADVKYRYRAEIGGDSWLPRGWTPPVSEANGNFPQVFAGLNEAAPPH